MFRPNPLRVAMLFGLLAAGAAQPAWAQQQQLTPQQRELARACRSDMRSLCSSVQPGGGRVVACLQQQRERLSPGCSAALNSLPSAPPS